MTAAAAPAPAVAIGVPARDEAATLPALLAALEAQRGVDRAGVVLCLHCDSCRDGTEALVRGWAGPMPVRVSRGEAGDANAGRARAAAMRLAEASGAAVLLTTDADSAPAPDWIAHALAALAQADVVAGRIVREHADAARDRVERYYDRLHALRRVLDPIAWEPAASHHHTGGANMAFRADAYRALGGFDPVPAGEDALIVDRAQRLGLRVRRDPALLVVTSSRRQGRAPGGVASLLGRGEGPPVLHPEDAAWQYRAHARARAAWDRLPAAAPALAAAIGLPEREVRAVAAECANAEAFATRVVPAPPAARRVPIAEAEAALAALEPANRECAA